MSNSIYTVTLKYNNEESIFPIRAVENVMPGSAFLLLREEPESLTREWLEKKDRATIIVDEPGRQIIFQANRPKYEEEINTISFIYGTN